MRDVQGVRDWLVVLPGRGGWTIAVMTEQTRNGISTMLVKYDGGDSAAVL